MTSRRPVAAAVLALLAACATAGPERDLTKLASAQLRSILVVPVLNRSVDVTAPDYFLSSVPVPVAERGYYVFPVNLVKRLLEDDGLADAGMVHAADPARLAAIFGADAVLYVTVDRWDARWVLVKTQVTVTARYVLRDGRTGEELWSGAQTARYDSGGSGGGGGGGALIQLVVDVVAAAVTKAAPNYMPLAQEVNTKAVAFPGPGLPAGPYHPRHGQDWAPPADTALAKAPAPTPTATPIATPTPTATATPSSTPSSEPAPAPSPATP